MSGYNYHHYILFKQPEGAIQQWRLFNISFGRFGNCAAIKAGTVDERLLGLAVFNEADEFQTLVGSGDFSTAMNVLGIDDYLIVSSSHTQFLDWTKDRDEQYWEHSTGAKAVIYDFINDLRVEILDDQKDNDLEIQRLIKTFEQEISSHIDEVDEDKAHSWPSLVYGWALAKGLDVNSAKDFVSRVNDCRWDAGRQSNE